MACEVHVYCDGRCGTSFVQTGKMVDWAPIGWMVISILTAMSGKVMWTPFGTIAKPTDTRRLRFFCSTKCVSAWTGEETPGLVWKDGRPPQFVPWEERYPTTTAQTDNDGTKG